MSIFSFFKKGLTTNYLVKLLNKQVIFYFLDYSVGTPISNVFF